MLPEARHSVAALTRLRQELSEDRQAMRVRLSEMEDARSRLEDAPWISHAAVAIHGWYTALDPAKVERELERVERMAGPIDRALSEVDEYLADAVRALRSQED